MTIGDLTRILIAVHGLPETLKSQMFQARDGYGLGVLVGSGGSWASRGDFFGYSTHIRLWPGSGTAAGPRTTGVAVFCNRQDSDVNSVSLGPLVEAIRAVVGGRGPGGWGTLRGSATAAGELIDQYGDVRARVLAAQVLAAHAAPEPSDSQARAASPDLPLGADLRRAVAARDGDQITEVIAQLLDTGDAAVADDAHWPT